MLYLIRHAESIGNAQRMYQGVSYDTDLTQRGRQQAQSLVHFANSTKIDSVISSPLKRTTQTADGLKHRYQTSANIIEINHGRWEGKRVAEFDAIDANLYAQYKSDPTNVKMPDGESVADVVVRVTQFISTLDHSLSIVLVTHDFIIRVLLAHFEQRSIADVWSYTVDNCGISGIDLSHQSVIYINQTDHLDGVRSDITNQAL